MNVNNSVGREAAWAFLEAVPASTLSDLFARDPERFSHFSRHLDLPEGGILFDWSKTHYAYEHRAGFKELAQACDFEGARLALFSGDMINPSEKRSAEHTAQRGMGLETSVEEAEALHARMRLLVEAIHAGAMGKVEHLIHIGIGGSARGPALAVDALSRDGALVDVHIVSNIDGCALEAAFNACDAATTLIAVASKTFTTVETLMNASSAMDWLRKNGVGDPFGRVIALTAFPEVAVEWGVDETRILPFPPSVGGRFSLWSSIGFPIALSQGWDEFSEFLHGGALMDQHFWEAEPDENLPLQAAFVDQLYAQLMGCQTRAVFAYDERLRLFPSYLQQLEMESNGKSRTLDGQPLDRPTAPITWGGIGSDCQHEVFQLLHQGSHLVPVEFLASIAPGHELDLVHHRTLLANCFAQGAAMMAGSKGTSAVNSHPGNRPSTTILLDDLSACALGALIAFYEHRTFSNAVLMGINPFDQSGVELGKEIARNIERNVGTYDPSTTALLAAAGLLNDLE